jgi:ubiquitin-protein ligase
MYGKSLQIHAGPEDTPYEGGLFVFDLFFPAQYPHLPPSTKLKTTGQGRARFNPDLCALHLTLPELLVVWLC